MASGESSSLNIDRGLLLAIAFGVFLASWLATVVAAKMLRRAGILDQPNARSSHRLPVPRGGGIGFITVALVAFAGLTLTDDGSATIGVYLGAFLVCAVSFADDIRHAPRLVRLAAQAAAVTLALIWLPSDANIIAGLPLWLERILVAIAWLWFINLFNFMDGIDGIAATEAVSIAAGLLLLAFAGPLASIPAAEAAVILAAALGFLMLNWHPARLFMGDIGSAGLGFLLGWLLLDLAADGYLAAAAILPMFFVLDTTTTLVIRLLRGEPFATAHRSHAYQKAIDHGLRQDQVVMLMAAVNVALAALALVSMSYPVPAAVAALVLTAAFTMWLRKPWPAGVRKTASVADRDR